MAKVCKFYKQKKQVSYDDGVTWQDVVPAEYQKGELYEKNSPSCGGGEAIYRTIKVDKCIFNDLYNCSQEQVSYDGGETWEDTSVSSDYYCVETDSADCGWQMPDMTNIKLYKVTSIYGKYTHYCRAGVADDMIPTDMHYEVTDCNGNTSTSGTSPSGHIIGPHTIIYGECWDRYTSVSLQYTHGHDGCRGTGDLGNPHPNVILSSKVTDIDCMHSHINKLRWTAEPPFIHLSEQAFSGTTVDNFEIPRNITRIGRLCFASAKVGSAITFDQQVAIGDRAFATSSIKTIYLNGGTRYIGDEQGGSPLAYSRVEKIVLNGHKSDYEYDFWSGYGGIEIIDNRID